VSTHTHTHTHSLTHTHTHTQAHTHTHALTLTLTLTHTHKHTHTLSLSHTHTHTHIHIHTHTHTHTHSHSLSHTHTYTHTHTHAHTHSRTHTHARARVTHPHAPCTRTLTRLMSGCHLPLLYIGMEYVATNNVAMAQQHFTQAHSIAACDPAVLHELGVVAFRTERYEAVAALLFLFIANSIKPTRPHTSGHHLTTHIRPHPTDVTQ
jgi:hypothetical protein